MGFATAVECDGETISITLSTGRIVQEAVSRHPFLASATVAERRLVEVDDLGTALYWPMLDEHIGVSAIIGVSEEDVARAAGFTIVSSRP